MAKKYSARFKFQVALAALTGARSQAQVAEAYGVHPGTVSSWKNKVLDKGPEVFATQSVIAEYERRIADLEQLVGQKEVEIARLKSLQRQMTHH